MLVLILVLVLVIAGLFALRSRAGRRVLVVVACLIVISVAGIWGYSLWHRPRMVANWLNINQPPESLSVKDCHDSGLLTDFVANCLVEIDPQHFAELLQGYNYRHDSTIDSEVSLATDTRQFALADTYTVSPATFEHGGAVTIYANAKRDQAVVEIYVE